MSKKIICFIIVFLCSVGHVFAEQVSDEFQLEIDALEACTDSGLGVTFSCNPQWRIQAVDDALLIIISTAPDVTIIVAKIDVNVKFLGQLTVEKLTELKQYKEGFVTENVTLGERDMIKVKAFAEKFPDRRLLDYYTIYNDSLYGLLFAVEPKDDMEKYQYLFKNIAESFSFIKGVKVKE